MSDPWDLPEGQTQHCEICAHETQLGLTPGSLAGHRCGIERERE